MPRGPPGQNSLGCESPFLLVMSLCVWDKEGVDGSKYPPSSLHGQLAGLLRHMQSIDPGCPNILDTSNVSCILPLMPLFKNYGKNGLELK